MNLRDLPVEALPDAPAGHAFSLRSLTREVGAARTGLSVYELEPGQAGWPYHFELNVEEWLVVIAGEVVLRTPEGERVCRAGDVACFPPGAAGAHALRNDGPALARFALLSAERDVGGGTVYPDSGKFSLWGEGFHHRGRLGEPVEYWEGEP